MDLRDAIMRFAALTFAIQDRDLERAWTWGEYDEGVRFAFFRTYEQLRDTAAEVGALRREAGQPQTLAQHILGQYHAAFMDMQAVLLGIDDQTAEREPAEGQWPLKRVVLHILQAERNFYGVCRYGVERERSQDGRPIEITDDAWDSYWPGDAFDQLKESGTFTEVMAYFEQLHQRVLDAFVDLRDEELYAASVFWETTPMPVRFRLHRFDGHMRQHTIQMEKARLQLGLPHPEALRLWRLIFAALAEVEGVRLGAGGIGYEDCQALADEIDKRRAEIVTILLGEFHARPPD